MLFSLCLYRYFDDNGNEKDLKTDCLFHPSFKSNLCTATLAPRGFGDLCRTKGYLFSGSWGALLIILGGLGSKHILLGRSPRGVVVKPLAF